METMVQKIKKEKNQPVKGKVIKKSDDNFYTYIQMVEKKAYELYEKRNCQHGRDQEDWFEAEKNVEAEMITAK